MTPEEAYNGGAVARGAGPLQVGLWAGSILMILLLATLNLWWGELNQDEGWYLVAARLVNRGQQPYLDFASTQGPVMAWVYALGYPLVSRWGMVGGRLFTVGLGLLGLLATAVLAARLAPRYGRGTVLFLALTLAGVNTYQSYFTTIVKTYALASLLLSLGFVALTGWSGRKGAGCAFLAGCLFALAAATRLSAGVVAPVALGVFAWRWIRGARAGAEPDADRRAFCGVLCGASLTTLLVFLPLAVQAPQALWFWLVEYHAGRQAGAGLTVWAYKAGFVSRMVQAYFVACSLFVVAAGFCLAQRRPRNGGVKTARLAGAPDPVIWCVGLGVLAMTAVHGAAPFPYDDYQVIVYPLFAVLTALVLTHAVRTGWRKGVGDDSSGGVPPARMDLWLRACTWLVCVAAAFSSPINQDWFLAERDRIWWPLREETPLARLGRAAARVRAESEPGSVLLTQDPYLAIESGRELPSGMELGPFSYYPDWPRAQAEARHVVNREMLLEIIESGPAPVAAFSGYGLAIRAPEIEPLSRQDQEELWAAVQRVYEPKYVIQNFGQAHTTLQILVRKPTEF